MGLFTNFMHILIDHNVLYNTLNNKFKWSDLLYTFFLWLLIYLLLTIIELCNYASLRAINLYINRTWFYFRRKLKLLYKRNLSYLP